MRIRKFLSIHLAIQQGLTAGLALLLAACSGLPRLAGAAPTEETLEPLQASGFLEAEEVSVVAESGGWVAEVLADEAEPVMQGQVLIRLDDGLLQAERARAEAAVGVARANLASLRAGADPEELAAAQAAIDEAEAALKGAQYAAGSAWAAASNPQAVDVQIVAAETQVALAARQIEIAQSQLEEARVKLGWLRTVDADFDGDSDAQDQDELAIEFQEYTVQILEANVRAAQAQFNGAQEKLDLLRAQRERPLSALAQANAAQSQVGIAEARVQLAQARYDLVANGALPEEIAIAEAQVALAEAQVALIDAQIAQLTLIAPIEGLVATRAVEVGETAQPGVALMTISDLSQLKLVVYIPETRIGQVRVGAPADVSVDSYPGETFRGVVTFVAREAEFTPRNVQTEEERVSLVFAVEITLENVDGRLKPGMPADATISILR